MLTMRETMVAAPHGVHSQTDLPVVRNGNIKTIRFVSCDKVVGWLPGYVARNPYSENFPDAALNPRAAAKLIRELRG